MHFEFELAEIKDAAERLWELAGTNKVLAFHGSMGAGKTTLIHALCEIKNVSSVVTSPTFSIINEYRYPGGLIYHIDLYRLKDEEEAIQAGVEDCLYSQQICLVEWPERAPGLFPDDSLHLWLSVKDTQRRILQIGNK